MLMSRVARILCVDDDAIFRSALTGYLNRQFEVETAENGKDALMTMREKGPFAVVISDMNMPGMDGSTFLNLVSEVAPDTVPEVATTPTGWTTGVVGASTMCCQSTRAGHRGAEEVPASPTPVQPPNTMVTVSATGSPARTI